MYYSGPTRIGISLGGPCGAELVNAWLLVIQDIACCLYQSVTQITGWLDGCDMAGFLWWKMFRGLSPTRRPLPLLVRFQPTRGRYSTFLPNIPLKLHIWAISWIQKLAKPSPSAQYFKNCYWGVVEIFTEILIFKAK